MSEFKLETAVPLLVGTIPGPHHVYRDADGNLLLWANSSLSGGGVAVNADSRAAFERLEGPKFYRLTNGPARLDKILPSDEVPFGACRAGTKGLFHPVDLVAPLMPPLQFGQDEGPSF